ncbi:MAG: hypothetical protein DI529_13895 [Chryseobacterium sp.]|nr:MAG: hypothetical protein DI529_13895 [Chryseobacterium sp.]
MKMLIKLYRSFKSRINQYQREKRGKTVFKKQHILYSSILKENDIFFDVGANWGEKLEIVKDLKVKTIAIEPQIKCADSIRERFPNVILENIALGSEAGELEMYISNADTLSTLSTDFIQNTSSESGRFNRYKWDEKVLVKVDTLENLISKHGKPKFIKIDVEGFEEQVLKGLKTPVDFISFEFTLPEMYDSFLRCIEILNKVYSENILFNVCAGSTYEYSYKDWLSYEQFLNKAKTGELTSIGGGDIYVKSNFK